MVVDDEESKNVILVRLSSWASSSRTAHTLLEAVQGLGAGVPSCGGRGEGEGWKKNVED